MTVKTPWHLWLVGILGLLWNSVGAFDYLMTQSKNDAYMAAFTPAQLEYFYSFPVWVVCSWAIAIWACVLGAILLLLRKKLSSPVFLVSIIGLVVTSIHNFGLSNGYEIMGGATTLIVTGIIYLTTIGLYFYARAMTKKGVLN